MDKIGYVDIKSAEYPEDLKNIKQPPRGLYYIGNLGLLCKRKVAVVGSRKATPYGKWVATKLCGELCRCDIVTVSGMARGIDSYAHLGALAVGDATIAVMGSGLDVCYPVSNRQLYEKIKERGLAISEYPPGTQAAKYTFPLRNRIISGLSEAVAVVEAGWRSGSLITAEYAAAMGKRLWAVPGNINNGASLGCNKLIHDGAEPLVTIEDIVESLGASCEEDVKEPLLDESEKSVYNLVRKEGEQTVDTIAIKLNMTPAKVSSTVTLLEIKGLLTTYFGKIFLQNGNIEL